MSKIQKSLNYYKNVPDVLNPDYLTHFLAYIIDGFIEMGEIEFVRPVVKKIFYTQNKDGSIPASSNANWIVFLLLQMPTGSAAQELLNLLLLDTNLQCIKKQIMQLNIYAISIILRVAFMEAMEVVQIIFKIEK